MRTLLLTLLAGCAAAAASPTAPTCKPTGDVLFEISDLVDQKPTAKVRQLYATGAWSEHSTDEAGKTSAGASGCLSGDKLDRIRADLKVMTWTVHHNRIHCMAVSPNYTVYKVGGKAMWTQRVCSSDALDDKSQKLLEEIVDLLAAG
jgi:hypothetical protein